MDALVVTIKAIKERLKYPVKDRFRPGGSIFQPVCVSMKPKDWEKFLIELEWLRKHENAISAL